MQPENIFIMSFLVNVVISVLSGVFLPVTTLQLLAEKPVCRVQRISVFIVAWLTVVLTIFGLFIGIGTVFG